MGVTIDLQSVAASVAATLVSAATIVAVLAFLGSKLVETRIDRYLSDVKHKQEIALADLRSALTRAERLEAELMKHRGEGYGRIWTLTGALNAFGTSQPVDKAKLADELRDWYFAHGWVLSTAARDRYFLVQEALAFAMLRDLELRRPRDEALYAGPGRTLTALKEMEVGELGLPTKQQGVRYSLEELAGALDAWKLKAGQAATAEAGWLMLRRLLSDFRSQVAQELGARGGAGAIPAATVAPVTTA